MVRCIVFIIFICLFCVPFTGAFSIGQTPFTTNQWYTLKLGGGGFQTNITIACDQGPSSCRNSGTSTKLVRSDTYGGIFYFNPNLTCGNTPISGGCWQPAMTAASMPAGHIDNNGGSGAYEIAIAPSNTSHWYMMYDGYVFSTSNKGQSWTVTSFSQVTADPNDNNKNMGNFMAVDPANENILLVGTPASGAFYTTDGGISFTHIAAIPDSATIGGHQGNALVAFDLSTRRSSSTARACATSQNTGIYCTTTGMTGTWSELNSANMPTTFTHMIIDPSGNIFVVDDTSGGGGGGMLWECAASCTTTWSQVSSKTIGSDAQAIAVDTTDANHLYVTSLGNTGELYGTTTGADGTWFKTKSYSCIATDVPWLTYTKECNHFLSLGNIVFDPASSNSLWLAEGIGVWNSIPPSSATSLIWNSVTAGIETLDITNVFSPPNANPIVMAQDRPLFVITNPAEYPSTVSGCANPQSNSIIYGYSGDYISGTTDIVAMCTQPFSPYTDESGISTNGGSSFTALEGTPTAVSSGYTGGCITATDANHIFWATAGNAGSNTPFVTSNGGTNWTQPRTLPGAGWPNTQARITMCTSDRVTSSTMYVYNYSYNVSFADAIYKSGDGGQTWTRECSNCAGGGKNLGNGVINGFFSVKLAAMPGQAGELWFTGGHQCCVTHPTSLPFYVSTDGNGATWRAISGMEDVWAFGFGAAKFGSSYATIYAYGWYNGVKGTWRSTDNGSTWIQIGSDNGYPLGLFGAVQMISGDSNIYGKVYECFSQGGCVYGQFN
jgi:hypothetical protein